MTTLFVQNDKVFTQMMIISLKPLFWTKKMSFDDFLMTTWEQEKENKRKKEPQIRAYDDTEKTDISR